MPDLEDVKTEFDPVKRRSPARQDRSRTTRDRLLDSPSAVAMPGTAFDRIAATLTSPVIIVTASGREERDGCLVGFSTQCSIEPLRYLVCLSKRNRTWELARDADSLVVHMLHDSPADRALARRFGEETGYEDDKFDGCDWERGPGDAPILCGCDWFSGQIVERIELGDHVGLVLDVAGGDAVRTSEPYLDFTAVRHLDAGNPA